MKWSLRSDLSRELIGVAFRSRGVRPRLLSVSAPQYLQPESPGFDVFGGLGERPLPVGGRSALGRVQQ